MSIFPTKVLLATDGSKEAELAAATARELAQRTESELHVVYVLALPIDTQDPSSFDPEVRRRMEERTRARLEELVGEIESSGGKVAGTHLGLGRADAQIVDLAEEVGAGLIVMGSRLRTHKASPHRQRLRLGREARPLSGGGGSRTGARVSGQDPPRDG